jgi:peroxiredoxin
LGRAAAALRRLRVRGLPALLGGVLVTVAAAIAGFTRPVSLVGFAVVGLAGGTTLVEYGRDVAERSRRRGEHPLQALYHLFGRNRRKYGGYLVHAGVILMALGIIGTRIYPLETEVVLSSGEPADVGGYTLVYEDLRQDPAGDHLSTRASVSVYREGAYLTTLQPRVNQYVSFDQTVAVPALRSGLREDLYLVLAGWGAGGETATLKVFVNPLASFLWLGGLVFLAGGAVGVWPAARAARLPAPEARRRRMGSAVGLAAGLLVLAAAGLAMWGAGQGAAAQPVGRLLPGQPAPDFTLNLLDGSTLSLSELRGQVAVVNFWATWCPPCEDELPDLEAVWTEYQAQGVLFVGIAFQEEEVEVREMAAQFGLTYPLGLDLGDRISTAFGITGVPETFVVDAQGRVSYVHIGPVNAEELRGELDSLVER